MNVAARAFAVAGLLAIPHVAAAAPIDFRATLSGSQEVPPTATSATGSAVGQLDGGPGAWVFTYTVTYSGLTGPVAAPFAHIHGPAAPGVNAGIIHDLDGANVPPIAGSTSGTITGAWRFDDAVRPLTDVRANELLNGLTYFNVHTTTFPGGEIRGQILRVPEPATLGLLATALALGATRRRRVADARAPS